MSNLVRFVPATQTVAGVDPRWVGVTFPVPSGDKCWVAVGSGLKGAEFQAVLPDGQVKSGPLLGSAISLVRGVQLTVQGIQVGKTVHQSNRLVMSGLSLPALGDYFGFRERIREPVVRRGDQAYRIETTKAAPSNWDALLPALGQLRAVLDGFVAQLRDGLDGKDGALACIPTYVRPLAPNKKSGSVLYTEVGGTNIRLGEVVVHGAAGNVAVGSENPYDTDKVTCLAALHSILIDGLRPMLSAGAQFEGASLVSILALQTRTVLNELGLDAVVEAMAKGVKIEGLLNVEAGRAARAAIVKAFPRLHSLGGVAISNDTVLPVLLARNLAAVDPGDAVIGGVIASGVNFASVVAARNSAKLRGLGLQEDESMVVNHEFGDAMCPALYALLTPYDRELDAILQAEADAAGAGHLRYTRWYEQMMAGNYLPRLFELMCPGALKEGHHLTDVIENCGEGYTPDQVQAATLLYQRSAYLAALGVLANRSVLPPHERTVAVIDGTLAWSGTQRDPDLYMKLMEQVFAALLPDGASIQIAGHPSGNRLAGAFLGLNLEQAIVRPEVR
jgi:hypothetical protein